MRIRTFIIPVIMGVMLLTGAELYKSFDTINSRFSGKTLAISEQDSGAGSNGAEEKNTVGPAGEDPGLKFYNHSVLKTAVIDYFTDVCGSRDMAETILSNAAEQNISVSLAFALAWKESNFRPNARNYNRRGSVDRGLFQLNNRYFKFSSEADVYDFRINTEKGLEHFKSCLETGGSEVVALAMYNAGHHRVSNGGTPMSTLNYIQKILNYREVLDRDLEDYMRTYMASLPNRLVERYLKMSLTQNESLNSLYQ
ncbi:MAG: transglycosylase SLT domain-containing protein [Spirochaetales bacterium]|nr:transglycosylase SLT domain-containing protein [Spirochaetales bacterium]